MITRDVETYLAEGCGRCELFQTPQCKVHLWTDALQELRGLLNASELTEEMKWGSPCYTLDGKNVVILASFKDNYALSFFKGILLPEADALEKPGPNTHAGRVLRFRSVGEVHEKRELVARLIEQAIAVERSGAQVEAPARSEEMPEELMEVLSDPVVADAWDALTPGRQRSYVLHVSGAKQSATRASRAEKSIPKILSGKGFHEY
ncbi:MAG: YdeI/OmpD-associated family protein [Myxococcota bacterium]